MTPWFQPVVSTSTRAVQRFEALVRYERADGTVLQPAQLLPLLDESGELGRLFPTMLSASLAACGAWRNAGIPAGVAVNVTTGDLRRPTLPDVVARTLAEHDLPASALTLELSESELLSAGDSAAASLSRLRGLGVRVAIDDFGAGHSSLARLADVAVSELKIDRSLVTSADADPRRQIVLRSAVDLGHRLGLEVVAEGVESDAVAGTVRAVGADSIQGYLFSRPMPLTDLLERYTPRLIPAPRDGAERTVPSAPVGARPIRRLTRWSRMVGSRTLAFAGVSSAVYVLWALLQPGNRTVDLWVGNAGFGLIVAAPIWLAIRAGRRTSGRIRQGWYLLAAATSSYLVGSVLQWFYESVLERAALPGPADVAYLAFYPLAMSGVLHLGRPLRDRASRRALALDLLTVTTGAAAVLVHLVLSPAVAGAAALGPALLASAYPIGDLLLLLAAAHVLLRGVTRAARAPLRLLVGSFLCFAVTDALYVNAGSYDSTSLLNIGWVAAMTGLLLAAGAGRRLPDLVGPPLPHAGAITTLSRLPYLAVAATFAVLLLSETGGSWSHRAVGVFAALTTACVVLRQLLAVRDNRTLARAYDALSSSDELTGLSTRRHFLAEAEREINLSARSDGRATGSALVLLDIDHFTAINERYGHQAGDQVLTAVAEACRNQLRQGDLLGRYGGDEIIALLPNSTVEAAESIAGRIDERLRDLCIDTATGPVLARITHGVAFVPAGEALEDALPRVAAALQTAKHASGLLHDPVLEPATG